MVDRLVALEASVAHEELLVRFSQMQSVAPAIPCHSIDKVSVQVSLKTTPPLNLGYATLWSVGWKLSQAILAARVPLSK